MSLVLSSVIVLLSVTFITIISIIFSLVYSLLFDNWSVAGTLVFLFLVNISHLVDIILNRIGIVPVEDT